MAEMPMATPEVPNSSGMLTLVALTVISRSPKAWPMRAGGVTCCSRLSTMGCSAPSVQPSNSEKPPATHGLGENG